MAETETAPTAPAPADRLREAAGVVRGWVAEAGPQPWAPGAVAAFGPEVAAWLETAAERHFPDDVMQIWPKGDDYQICGGCSPIDNEQRWPCPDMTRALAVADAILAPAVSR